MRFPLHFTYIYDLIPIPSNEQFNIRYHTTQNRCHCHLNSKQTSHIYPARYIPAALFSSQYTYSHIFSFLYARRTTPLFHENLIQTTRLNDNYIETENHIVNIRITYTHSKTPHYIYTFYYTSLNMRACP